MVVLTSRAGEHQPSLDVEDVRAIVGPRALIYFLPTGPLSFDLADRVPDRRGPYNGSLRVWLPDVSPESDRRDHPQVFDPTGEYGPRSLRQLAYGLREAFFVRGIEPPVDPVVAHRSLEIIRVLDEADVTKRGYEEQLSRAREERDEAAQRARDEDPEGALRVLILQRWLETLSHEERTQHPLGRYVLGPEFVRSAEGLIDLVRDRLAFVCAMIACNRVGDLAALAQSPLSHNSKAHHDHDSLKDSESAWQCSLTRPDSQTPPAVRYLQHADGTISFTGMGVYKPARSGR